jgi:hypothetical protein
MATSNKERRKIMADKDTIDRSFDLVNLRDLIGPIERDHPLWRMHWTYSGRYRFGKTLIPKKKEPISPRGSTMSPQAPVNEKLYLPENALGATESLSFNNRLAIQLRIDIDSRDPLNVVSGTAVELFLFPSFRRPAEFIGKVVKNKKIADGRILIVEEFTFNWPGTREVIDRMVIKLTPSLPSLSTPIAEVTLITTGRRLKGPFTLKRTSQYFRDVEVEVDMEDGAINPEPYNTHTHPDRPAGMPSYNLTFDSAYRRAGINITRTAGGTNTIDSTHAGPDERWTELELHEAMENHWSTFANRSQWKMWVFLAEQAVSRTLAGIMFDSYIDEPGGVDRQGTAVFTQCPALHAEYAADNPPGPEAVQRELFALMVHESGHAFNLYHPWQKSLDTPWSPPTWMPLTNRNFAMTWMNYSFRASRLFTGVDSLSAEWFYENFGFRFDDMDNLFLRHAPDRFVIMGGSDWGLNHGMVLGSMLDQRLELILRSRKVSFELGEPVTIELRLKNISKETIILNNDFDLQSGRLELAITSPNGERKPFLPFISNDIVPEPVTLAPGKAIYLSVNLAIGIGGCPFKEPGTYRIDAGYNSAVESAAAGSMQMQINPPANAAGWPVVRELFNARIGRLLYIGGSRIMKDALDRIKWVSDKIGKKHPAQFQLARAMSSAYMRPIKSVDIQNKRLELLDPDPEKVAVTMKPVIDRPDAAADSLGHIAYTQLVYDYADCTMQLPKKGQAAKALREMLELYQKRKVIKKVIDSTKDKLEKIE